MKRAMLLLGVVFSVALAIVVGNRMSTDAIAVVVGIGCGVLSGIPTSLLLIWAWTRRAQSNLDSAANSEARVGHQYPPVVVVNSPTGRPSYGFPEIPAPSTYALESGQMPMGEHRSFRVMGAEETAGQEIGW